MAMEVVHGEGERDARLFDSVVLSRAGPDGLPSGSNCNLKASAMRTVRSYQIMQVMGWGCGPMVWSKPSAHVPRWMVHRGSVGVMGAMTPRCGIGSHTLVVTQHGCQVGV